MYNKEYNIISKSIRLDDGAQAFLLTLFFSQLFFSNGIYLFLGTVCFAFIVYYLQQPLKPSIFTLMFIYHLLQVMSGVWLSNFLERDINFRSYSTDTATIFSYIGLIFLFAPIIYYQRKIPSVSLATLQKHAARLSIQKSFKVYVVGFFAMNALAGVAFVVPGLTQVIFSFVNIKWFLFLLFGLQVFLKNTMKKEFYFFVALEFLLGFFSYFSDFKTVMFFVAFIAMLFLIKVSIRNLVVSALLILGIFYLAVKWTSIKGEYRVFLNKGTSTQTVNVERKDALNKLLELSESSDGNSFDASAAEFFSRLQYTYHLAKTMDRIPAVLPHENGANIGSILSFVTTPRFLNPDKPKLEASVKATKYTGIGYLGASSGVSFSLGYFADCYIDFGYYGMMVPLFILGLLFGSTYFYFVKKSSPNFIFNYAVVGGMYMEFLAFEMDGTYLMGRLFATLLTFLMLKFFAFPWLYNNLSAVASLTENEERAADKQEKMERLQAKSSSP